MRGPAALRPQGAGLLLVTGCGGLLRGSAEWSPSLGLEPQESLGPQLPCPLGLATSSASPSAGSGKASPWHGLPFSHTTHPRTYTDNGFPPTHLWLPEPKDLQFGGWLHWAGPALSRAARPRVLGDTCQTGALGSPAGLHLVLRPRHQTRKGSFAIWDRECRDLTWPGASRGEPQADQVKLQGGYGHAPCGPAPSPPRPQPGLWLSGSLLPHPCAAPLGSRTTPRSGGSPWPPWPPQSLRGLLWAQPCRVSPHPARSVCLF